MIDLHPNQLVRSNNSYSLYLFHGTECRHKCRAFMLTLVGGNEIIFEFQRVPEVKHIMFPCGEVCNCCLLVNQESEKCSPTIQEGI